MTDIDKEIERFDKRMNVFMSEGLCREGAYDLASAMFERDRDPHDDRRVCFECTHYVGKACMKIKDKLGKPQMPLRFVLQRCDFFKLKGSK
jgi:hypothetical protein